MALVDEVLEGGRATVRVLHGEREDAVVAPVARARELGDRHDFDRRDPEHGEVVELRDGRGEGAGRGERADVELVEHRVAQRHRLESVVAPLVVAQGATTADGPCTPSG